MIGFYLLGAAGVLMLVGNICYRVGGARAYRRGVFAGKRIAEHDEFMRGVLWYSATDDQVEATRRQLWKKEIGA